MSRRDSISLFNSLSSTIKTRGISKTLDDVRISSHPALRYIGNNAGIINALGSSAFSA
jgi:hypothetical protein